MTIKVGIIGLGSIARFRHLPETAMNPQAEISAICDIVPQRVKEMAEKYNCQAYTNYQKMLKQPDLDAVIVAATNTTHAQMTIAALEAGKHVLCEKPMATSLEDASKMIEAANKAGKKLMIAHNQRLEPAHQKAKEIIQSGKLGKVLTFTAVFGHPGSEYWAIDGENTWFYRRDVTGLGVLGDLAIHKLDLLRWILEDEYTHASAFIDTLSKTYPNGELIDVEDNAHCLLRTQKGTMGSVIASWTYQKENNSTTLYCENGVVQIYVNPEFSLVVHYDKQNSEYHKLGRKSTNVAQVKSGIIDTFVEALVKDCEVPITGMDGYKAVEAVLACQRAAETGKVVEIQ